MTRAGWSGDWILLVGSLGGGVVALAAYLREGSGVVGTTGALLACIGCLALTLAALIYLFAGRQARWLRRILDVLVVLGAIGTALAGYMLMQTWIVVAMAVVIVGIVMHHIGRRAVT